MYYTWGSVLRVADKQMVPFRMAPDGVEWLDALASKLQISRSDAIRVCLWWAVECESDGRVSAYGRRQLAKGRITQVKPKTAK